MVERVENLGAVDCRNLASEWACQLQADVDTSILGDLADAEIPSSQWAQNQQIIRQIRILSRRTTFVLPDSTRHSANNQDMMY
jgi:hypothetical protein